MSVLIFIISIAILILAHEFGHFIAAKRAGIRVDEFGIGFPPRIFSWRRGETLYSLNAIPFGGFVKIFGEDGETDGDADRARNFSAKNRFIQSWVIVAGVIFNFIVGWLLFSAAFLGGLPMGAEEVPENAPITERYVLIAYVEEGTPAAMAGLQTGDMLRSVTAENGIAIAGTDFSDFQSFIAAHPNEKLTVRYERGGEEASLTVTPQEGIVEGRAAIGIAMENIAVVHYPIHRALWEGLGTTATAAIGTASAFGSLVADAFRGEADLENLTGPIGIVSMTGKAAAVGFPFLLWFIALISINLGVLNLLPIPGLDGGRLYLIWLEGLRGTPFSPRSVAIAHTAGFALLIVLMLVVSYHDIIRLWG